MSLSDLCSVIYSQCFVVAKLLSKRRDTGPRSPLDEQAAVPGILFWVVVGN
jgi:hypothetical protein